jgi:hypothetical protein
MIYIIETSPLIVIRNAGRDTVESARRFPPSRSLRVLRAGANLRLAPLLGMLRNRKDREDASRTLTLQFVQDRIVLSPLMTILEWFHHHQEDNHRNHSQPINFHGSSSFIRKSGLQIVGYPAFPQSFFKLFIYRLFMRYTNQHN